MSAIKCFRELKSWQKSMDLVMRIFELTKLFPVEERYSLTDQMRRSSRSVPSNIAEAWRKRRYPAAFVSKLNDAEGEAAETQTHIEIARRCGYVTSKTADELDAEYEEILAILATMDPPSPSRPLEWKITASPHSPLPSPLFPTPSPSATLPRAR